jgi:hypothetical protein
VFVGAYRDQHASKSIFISGGLDTGEKTITLLDHRELFSYITIEFIHSFIQTMGRKRKDGFCAMI